jgi:transposase
VRTQTCPLFFVVGILAGMAPNPSQPGLFAPQPSSSDAIVINDRCVIRTEDAHWAVLVCGIAVDHFHREDRLATAHAMVTLVEQGLADQNDVARAFGCSTRTVRRYQRRYEEGGMVQLGRAAGYPRGRPRAPASDRLLGRLKASGMSNRAIAHRLGIGEKAVRKRLRRLGWTSPKVEQVPLPFPTQGADPNLSGSGAGDSSALPPGPDAAGAGHAAATSGSAAAVTPADPNLSAFSGTDGAGGLLAPSFDDDPADRRWDRLFAYLGLIDDAVPLFRDGSHVAGAGVLLALPALVGSGVFTVARQVYGSIGPAFYGLRTTILTLLLMALLRIKRPEALKEHSPPELGRVLGLDRAPEVKTLRRKLTRLAHLGGADALGGLLAQRRVAHGLRIHRTTSADAAFHVIPIGI